MRMLAPILLIVTLAYCPFNFLFSQDKQTYKVGQTTYVVNETYKTTGYPKVERSSTAKKEFLRSQGYRKAPRGYQVDHIVPLSQGGADAPSNMQLISIQQHKLKTASERYRTATTHTNIPRYNNKSTTFKSNKYYSTPTYTPKQTKTIMTGPRGGKYFYNSKGSKTYIKKN